MIIPEHYYAYLWRSRLLRIVGCFDEAANLAQSERVNDEESDPSVDIDNLLKNQ